MGKVIKHKGIVKSVGVMVIGESSSHFIDFVDGRRLVIPDNEVYVEFEEQKVEP